MSRIVPSKKFTQPRNSENCRQLNSTMRMRNGTGKNPNISNTASSSQRSKAPKEDHKSKVQKWTRYKFNTKCSIMRCSAIQKIVCSIFCSSQWSKPQKQDHKSKIRNELCTNVFSVVVNDLNHQDRTTRVRFKMNLVLNAQ